MGRKITRRFFAGTVALGSVGAFWAMRQPSVARVSGEGLELQSTYFATLADANGAAETGRIAPGTVAVILHHSVPGDRGGFAALVIDPGARASLRAHPQAERLALLEDEPTPEMFGAAVDSQGGVQRWLDWGGGLRLSRSTFVDGQVAYGSDTAIRGRPGATLKPSGHVVTGTFLTARDPRTMALEPARGVVLEDVDINGDAYPEPTYFRLVRATADTLILPQSASDADNAYKGLFFQVCQGGDVARRRLIRRYDGASRTVTFRPPLEATEAGDTVVIGTNANAFAAVGGARDIRVVRGRIANFRQESQVPFVSGGKGVNFESGVTNGHISGTTFFNCTTAVFFQGIDETYPESGISRSVINVHAENIHAEECGSALTIAGIDKDQMPDGNPATQMASATGITYRNCGHAPMRIVSRNRQKCGIVNLMEAQNFHIADVSGHNLPGYPQEAPGYPTDFPNRVGYGLDGPVGAMVWGHGRNGLVRNFTHHGDVDAVVHIQRCRALGDDAPGQKGRARNCFDLRFEGMKLYGYCRHAIAVDTRHERAVPDDELTGILEVVVDGIRDGICGPQMAGHDGFVLDVTERGSGRRVIGTPRRIVAAGNRFDAFAPGLTDLRIGGR